MVTTNLVLPSEMDNKVKVTVFFCFLPSFSSVQHWIKPRSWRSAMATWWSGWRRWRPTGALCCPSNSHPLPHEPPLLGTGMTLQPLLCPAARDASCHCLLRPGHPNTCSVPPRWGLPAQIQACCTTSIGGADQVAVPTGALPHRALGTFEVQHIRSTWNSPSGGHSSHLLPFKMALKEKTLTGILCLAENFKTNTVSLGLFSWQYL